MDVKHRVNGYGDELDVESEEMRNKDYSLNVSNFKGDRGCHVPKWVGWRKRSFRGGRSRTQFWTCSPRMSESHQNRDILYLNLQLRSEL